MNSELRPQILELLKFLSSFDKLEGGKSFFGTLDDFFKKTLSSSPLVVYSFPQNKEKLKDKSPFDVCRIHWNKKIVNKHYDPKYIESILGKALETPDIVGNWDTVETDGTFRHSFYFGESSKQIFIGFIDTKEKIEEVFTESLLTFFKSNSQRILVVNDLKKLEELVHVDDVTGLYNQRKLVKDLETSIRRSKEFNENFSVLFLDIDHFKQVNDGHGHLVGTQILCDMAEILKLQIRESDLIYRYGGDEFVIIIRDVDQELSLQVGERILKCIKKTDFIIKENDIFDKHGAFNLTVSIGIAHFPEDAKTRDEVIAIADKMMYQAKESGRGRVCRAIDSFKGDSAKKKA